MPLKIKVTPAALLDIQKGITYYNQQQEKLGVRFESVIHTTFKQIMSMPLSASFAYDNVRYKVTKNFPYIVLYEIDDVKINVLRVYNTSLSPEHM